MSFPDCVRVAKGVFLDTATLYFRDLIMTVEGQVRSVRAGDRRRLGQGWGGGACGSVALFNLIPV